MLRLKKLKQEKDAAVAAKKAGNVEVVTSPGELRIQKEVGEIDTVCGKDKTIAVSFPDPDNLMAFNVTIQPAEGYWKVRAAPAAAACMRADGWRLVSLSPPPPCCFGTTGREVCVLGEGAKDLPTRRAEVPLRHQSVPPGEIPTACLLVCCWNL